MGFKVCRGHAACPGTLCTLLAVQCLAVTNRFRVDPASGHFIDKDGRARFFHGVNVVYKQPPWHPSRDKFHHMNSLTAKDFSDLKSWGLNLLRLGVMWHGVEPENGEYNTTYLQVMREIADEAYKNGIYTVVDFHQDAFTEQFCGEGFPNWLLPMLEPIRRDCKGILPAISKLIGQCKSFKEYNFSTNPNTGYPLISDCLTVRFDHYSRTPEVTSSWGNFFAYDAVQWKFRDFWKIVAKSFAGHPGLLGYAFLNEPLNGNFFEKAKLLQPGYADLKLLQPMYQALHTVIQSVDPGSISHFEMTPFPDTVPSNIPVMAGVYNAGFTSGPAGADHARQALNYHVYSCGFADPRCDREGETFNLDCPICDTYATEAVQKRTDDAKRLGGGIVMSEFGACKESPKCLAEINRVLSRADRAMHSWAYWQFKYFEDITTLAGPSEGFYWEDGKLQTKKVAALSRTYAPAIAGLPTQLEFNQWTGAFRLVYEIRINNRSLPTEIYMNEDLNYKSGYEVHAINAAVKHPRRLNGIRKKNHLNVWAKNTSGTVDIAIVRTYHGPFSGFLLGRRFRRRKNQDRLDWHLFKSAAQPGFQLKTDTRSTSWKMVKVIADDEQEICQLITENKRHVARCILNTSYQHQFLFNYTIEFWKANRKTAVQSVNSSYFGPLLGKRISFTWRDAHAARSESTNGTMATEPDGVVV